MTGFTNACTGTNELCWPLFDSDGAIVHEEAGYCISDSDISDESLICDCAGNPGAGTDKCAAAAPSAHGVD